MSQHSASSMRLLITSVVLALGLGCCAASAERVLFSVPINLGAEHQFNLAIHDSDVDAASSEAAAEPGLARVAGRFCSDRGVAAGVPVSACESALVSGLRREWSKYLAMSGRAQAQAQAHASPGGSTGLGAAGRNSSPGYMLSNISRARLTQPSKSFPESPWLGHENTLE